MGGVLNTPVTIDPENVEPTFNKYSFVSPFWCPFTVISWLASKSIPVKGSGASSRAGYAFFENKFGHQGIMDGEIVGDNVGLFDG